MRLCLQKPFCFWICCRKVALQQLVIELLRVGRKKLSLQTLIIPLQVVSTLYHIVIQT